MNGIPNGRVAAALTVAFLLPAAVLQADEIDNLVNTLKPSPLNYAVWAEKLLKAAEDLKDKPEAQARLYEKAYEYGLKGGKGCPTAIKAAQALMEARPKEKLSWQQKLLAAYKLDWQTADRTRKKEAGRAYVEHLMLVADGLAASGSASEALNLYTEALYKITAYAPDRKAEVAQKLKDIRERQKLQNQMEQYRRVLVANPTNVVMREKLILLHVVELDDPAKAKELLTPDVSEKLRTYVPLAVMDTSEVATAVCIELGDWYMSLASKATLRGKANTLSRARTYYERSVKLETDAVRRIGSKAKLDQVDKELLKLGMLGYSKYLTLDLGKGLSMKLVIIPAGTFIMGSPKDEPNREAHEGPQHKVTITKPFYMGVYEVTQEQYLAVMEKNPSKDKGQKNPVERVSWNDAIEFCKRLSVKVGKTVRLPSEAEWEYACRAGTTRAYCFGDEPNKLKEYAWFKTNAGKTIHPVGQKTPNSWRLYDMHGNVFEWCGDWYDEAYYAAGGNTVDPTGPASGSSRVARGSCFYNHDWSCSSAYRHGFRPGYRYNYIGFRVVLPVASRGTPR